MNSLLSSLTSSFPTWATLFATTVGSFSLPGCPRPQTPRASTPESESSATVAAVVQDFTRVTPEVRPVTIPAPEEEPVLLP